MITEAATAPRVNGLTEPVRHMLAPEKFWLQVDDRLNALGQPNALWLDELVRWYAAGLSVDATVRRVLAGRRVA